MAFFNVGHGLFAGGDAVEKVAHVGAAGGFAVGSFIARVVGAVLDGVDVHAFAAAAPGIEIPGVNFQLHRALVAVEVHAPARLRIIATTVHAVLPGGDKV